MDVIKHLRELQTEYGLTDYKIAKAAGLSSGTVSNILKRNTYPRIDTLENICKAFGLTLSQFFAEGELVELTPELRESLLRTGLSYPMQRKQLYYSSSRHPSKSSYFSDSFFNSSKSASSRFSCSRIMAAPS